MAPRSFNLALVGFGNVGRTFVDLLERKRGALRSEYGIEFRLTGVATRRLGWIAAPGGLDGATLLRGEVPAHPEAHTVRQWIKAARADVLFETTSLNRKSGEPAIDHLRAALESGAHAVSANKGPVVFAYRELTELARTRGKRFLFESAVMDGVPIFSLFAFTLPTLEVRGFRAVLNATTNFILERMESGAELREAIRQAQELGVAETDPSDDVDGWDAAFKTVALANVIMGARLRPEDVVRQGIGELNGEEVMAARVTGRPFKLLCEARRTPDGVSARVAPTALPPSDPLAGISGTSSAIYFETDMFPGLGITEVNGGLDATAYGLLADFVRAVRP
jgi:homoserine dehydrogenase